jgi:hypothetical protein
MGIRIDGNKVMVANDLSTATKCERIGVAKGTRINVCVIVAQQRQEGRGHFAPSDAMV